MKKYKSLFITSTLVLIVAICCLLPHQNGSVAKNQDISASGGRPTGIIIRDYSEYKTGSPACAMPAAFHQNIDELAEYSGCIVRGIYYDDARQPGTTNSVLEKNTISTFEVTEVIKGELSTGDNIPLYETYYINEAEKTIYHYWNCYPADPGREYLVFMFSPRGNQKNYSVVGLNGMAFARFPVVDGTEAIDVNAFSDAELNLGYETPKSASAEFRFFYAQAIEKYMK